MQLMHEVFQKKKHGFFDRSSDENTATEDASAEHTPKKHRTEPPTNPG